MGNLIIKRIAILYFVHVLLTVCVDCNQNITSSRLERAKRFLDFQKATRVFFRANAKNNILSINSILAYAYGFKANYPIVNDKIKKLAMKRDIYEVLEEFLDNHGFDGEACVLKSFCTSTRKGQHTGGILFKTFKKILSYPVIDEHGVRSLIDEK